MRKLIVSVLVLAAIGASAGVANAQPGLSGGLDVDALDASLRMQQERKREADTAHKAGYEALQAKDYLAAEQHFARLLAMDTRTNDAHYLMGLAQMGLEKWTQAKTSLEEAVIAEPNRPEAKARLGVAHVMLGDINSAADQHDALGAMARACNGCPDQKNINDNLLMLDRILVAATKPKTPG